MNPYKKSYAKEKRTEVNAALCNGQQRLPVYKDIQALLSPPPTDTSSAAAKVMKHFYGTIWNPEYWVHFTEHYSIAITKYLFNHSFWACKENEREAEYLKSFWKMITLSQSLTKRNQQENGIIFLEKIP